MKFHYMARKNHNVLSFLLIRKLITQTWWAVKRGLALKLSFARNDSHLFSLLAHCPATGNIAISCTVGIFFKQSNSTTMLFPLLTMNA